MSKNTNNSSRQNNLIEHCKKKIKETNDEIDQLTIYISIIRDDNTDNLDTQLKLLSKIEKGQINVNNTFKSELINKIDTLIEDERKVSQKIERLEEKKQLYENMVKDLIINFKNFDKEFNIRTLNNQINTIMRNNSDTNNTNTPSIHSSPQGKKSPNLRRGNIPIPPLRLNNRAQQLQRNSNNGNNGFQESKGQNNGFEESKDQNNNSIFNTRIRQRSNSRSQSSSSRQRLNSPKSSPKKSPKKKNSNNKK